MAKIDSLEPLMIDELRDLLDAEKQITKALPKMAKAASNEQLRSAFEMHLNQTNGQIERLNQVFDELGQRARGKTCEALIEQLTQSCFLARTRDGSVVLRSASA